MRARGFLQSAVGLTASVAMSSAAIAGNTFTWIGGNGAWNDPAMWGGVIPNGGADVNIDGGNGAASMVSLNVNANVANLAIDANDELFIGVTGTQRLDITNSITNLGIIRLADPGSGSDRIGITGVVNLDGNGGMLIFDSANDNQVFPAANGTVDTIVNGVGHIITTGPTADPAESFMSVLLENDGTVEADEGGLELRANVVNRNLMQAINGGTLEFANIDVDNVAGDINAGANSVILINSGSDIIGGDLTGSGSFFIAGGTSTFNADPDPINIAANTTIDIRGSATQRLNLIGDFVNNGEFLIDDDGSGSNILGINGVVNLNGNGEIRLTGPNDNQIVPAVNGSLDRLVIGPDQSIVTDAATTLDSFLSVLLTNNGLVHADGGQLELRANVINNNILRASNGGNLDAANVDITNIGQNIEINGATSTLTLRSGSDIIGGTITGDGSTLIPSGTVTFDSTTEAITIGENMTVDVRGSSTKRLNLLGDLVNEGEILIDDAGSGTNSLGINGVVNLNGDGVVRMTGPNDNQIIPAVNGSVDRLIVGSNQVIVTDNMTGVETFFSVLLTNNGLIHADGGQLEFNANVINNNILRASNGGNLEAANVDITNVGQTIEVNGASSTLTLRSGTDIIGGTITGTGTVIVPSGISTFDGTTEAVTTGDTITVDVRGNSTQRLNMIGDVVNNGEILIDDAGSGTNSIGINDVVNLTGDGVMRMTGPNDNQIIPAVNGNVDRLVVGANQVITTDDMTDLDSFFSVLLTNNGLIEADGGQLEFNANIVNNSDMRSSNGGNLQFANVDVDNTNGTIEFLEGNTVTLTSGTDIIGGTMIADGTLATTGNTTLDGVTLLPGNSPGILDVNGNMPTQTETTVTEIEIGGFTPGTEHDQINVTGNARFGGTLRVRAVNGYVPAVGDSFRIFNYGAHSPQNDRYDEFDSIGFPGILTVRVDYEVDHADLVVVAIGDINCDGMITVSDIAPLVIALTDPDNYEVLFPNCPILDADVNGDGEVTVADIGPFVALLTGGG